MKLLVGLLFITIALKSQDLVSNLSYNGKSYAVVDINLSIDTVRFDYGSPVGTDSNSVWLNLPPVDASNIPLGCFIENGKLRSDVNLSSGGGNFYLKPNGVLSMGKIGDVAISNSEVYKKKEDVFAIQSGPMFVSNGVINPNFNYFSKNLNYRSGIGVYSDLKGDNHLIIFVSKELVNLHDVSEMLIQSYGCKNAVAFQSANCFLHYKGKTFGTPGYTPSTTFRIGIN